MRKLTLQRIQHYEMVLRTGDNSMDVAALRMRRPEQLSDTQLMQLIAHDHGMPIQELLIMDETALDAFLIASIRERKEPA